MVELKLRIRSLPDGTVVLELGLGFRLLFGALATVLAMGVASSGQAGVVPVVALAVLTLGALYQEQWVFDPQNRIVRSRHGLMVLARRREWSFEEIAGVEYTHYRAGSVPGSDQPSPPGSGDPADDPRQEAWSTMGRVTRGLRRHFLRYSMVTTDGARVRLEIRRVRDWNADVRLPQTIAEVMGVPLEESPI